MFELLDTVTITILPLKVVVDGAIVVPWTVTVVRPVGLRMLLLPDCTIEERTAFTALPEFAGEARTVEAMFGADEEATIEVTWLIIDAGETPDALLDGATRLTTFEPTLLMTEAPPDVTWPSTLLLDTVIMTTLPENVVVEG